MAYPKPAHIGLLAAIGGGLWLALRHFSSRRDYYKEYEQACESRRWLEATKIKLAAVAAAQKGDAEAAEAVAKMWLHGDNYNSPDPKEAERWFAKAAQLRGKGLKPAEQSPSPEPAEQSNLPDSEDVPPLTAREGWEAVEIGLTGGAFPRTFPMKASAMTPVLGTITTSYLCARDTSGRVVAESRPFTLSVEEQLRGPYLETVEGPTIDLVGKLMDAGWRPGDGAGVRYGRHCYSARLERPIR
jgi:hypothetical protein